MDDNRRGRGNSEVPELLRDGLIANGVAEKDIEVIPDEVAAIDAALNMGEMGDLLMIFGDNISRSWKQIIYFNRDLEEASDDEPEEEQEKTQALVSETLQSDPLADATPVEDAPEVPESVLLGGMRMIRDSRGVRLAVEEVEDSD